MIDLRIIYTAGSPIAFLRPETARARIWLSDHVKGRRLSSSAIIDASSLLPLIAAMQTDKLNLHWQER
jgi:hypothetical protein